MKTDDLIADLPGETLIRQGLADFSSGRWTVSAYLVAIARPRLVKAGLIADSRRRQIRDPELQLYRLLQKQGGDAYSRYNSLVRELVSFEQALDHRCRRRNEREGIRGKGEGRRAKRSGPWDNGSSREARSWGREAE